MHPNEALIARLYTCFQARDAAGMKACYHPDAVFSDPVFGRLEGEQVTAMWAMLCERAADLRIDVSDVTADDASGQAHWDARYTFSQTGRKVLNRIDAEFGFRDGLIARHDDRFSFWRWSRQALGPIGLALGWTPLLRARVGANARKGLAAYMRRNAERSSDKEG
ncbi:MAG TPA: nuclear transport factor 2 family protein [Longimicrobiaceae bacterium]|nr:nuclear transport factor 2 family protein [Longimicrobiaceae bacterium]